MKSQAVSEPTDPAAAIAVTIVQMTSNPRPSSKSQLNTAATWRSYRAAASNLKAK